MLIEKINTDYNNYRIPGLVMTQNGTLIGYYECRREVSDWAEIDLKIVRSVDKGETWETVKIISGKGHTLNNPVMIPNGNDVHFLYMRNYKELLYCKSEDDGISFPDTDEVKGVFEQGGFSYNVAAIGPGHGIIHNGNIIIPVWFAYNEEKPKAHYPSFIASIYSLDGGKSWKMGEIIGKETLINPSECAFAVTKDDKVLISIRNENDDKRRALSVSDTGYSGWSEPECCENLRDPICQGSMDSENGRIYHINCDNERDGTVVNNATGRLNLTIKISDDYFKTYKSIVVSEVGGYSDIAVHENEIYVLYEKDPTNDGLYFKKIKY